MPCPRLAARPARGGGQLVQRLLLLRAAQHPRKPPLRRRRTRLRHVENLRQQPRLRPQAGIRLSRRRGGLRPVERILRPGLSRFVERTDGHLALDRAGRTGLHAAANGQLRGHPGQPGLLLHPPHRQAYRRARFDRPPFLRKAVYDDRPQTLPTDRRGNVARRERRRHLDRGAARRLGRLRQDGHGPESAGTRPFDLPVVRTEGQSPHRDLGLRRKRRIRRHDRPADRLARRRVLPHRHDHPPVARR